MCFYFKMTCIHSRSRMLAYARMLPGVQGLNIGPCRGTSRNERLCSLRLQSAHMASTGLPLTGQLARLEMLATARTVNSNAGPNNHAFDNNDIR